MDDGADSNERDAEKHPLTYRPTEKTRDAEEVQNKMINEEYKIWKKNSVFLYDVMYRWVIHLPCAREPASQSFR